MRQHLKGLRVSWRLTREEREDSPYFRWKKIRRKRPQTESWESSSCSWSLPLHSVLPDMKTCLSPIICPHTRFTRRLTSVLLPELDFFDFFSWRLSQGIWWWHSSSERLSAGETCSAFCRVFRLRFLICFAQYFCSVQMIPFPEREDIWFERQKCH